MIESFPVYEGPEYIRQNDDGTELHRFPNGHEVTVKPFVMEDGGTGLEVDEVMALIKAAHPELENIKE